MFVAERTVGRITNDDIYNLCQEILTNVRDYNERQITMLNDIKRMLEEIYEGIKTLSDNQVVIDEKIEDIRSKLENVRKVVYELRAVLPGV